MERADRLRMESRPQPHSRDSAAFAAAHERGGERQALELILKFL
jgi:hypothetical protein